ncbi:flavoprotein [Gandjariella thermophila]|uniref:Flavoprotein n=1 Tax=Gandjariella thermophila TaxID=1931992 RepID=A0A4D4J731_9PSEU|nr:flavoprotein [Gandjariella thermophila]GDY30810.1 flavoprotein [Gandjariella thermophila]
MGARVLGVVGCGAAGVQELLPRLVHPARRAGWTVAVTLTPTAGRWLRELGLLAEIERVTGFVARVEPRRSPLELSPHPPADCYVVAPASANTVAKLALGIADNQALTQVNEAIGTADVAVVVAPRVNEAHARHPAWQGHLATLRDAGVHLVSGDGVWSPPEPSDGQAAGEPPWTAILDAIDAAVPAR